MFLVMGGHNLTHNSQLASHKWPDWSSFNLEVYSDDCYNQTQQKPFIGNADQQVWLSICCQPKITLWGGRTI